MKKIFRCIPFLLLASNAWGQVFVDQCVTLMDVTAVSSTQTGSIKKFTTFGNVKSLSVVAVADANSGTPTLDITVQSCLNDGDTPFCSTLFTFDQCTTGTCWSSTGNRQIIDLNESAANAFPYLRAVATIGGSSPNYDVFVKACFRQ